MRNHFGRAERGGCLRSFVPFLRAHLECRNRVIIAPICLSFLAFIPFPSAQIFQRISNLFIALCRYADNSIIKISSFQYEIKQLIPTTNLHIFVYLWHENVYRIIIKPLSQLDTVYTYNLKSILPRNRKLPITLTGSISVNFLFQPRERKEKKERKDQLEEGSSKQVQLALFNRDECYVTGIDAAKEIGYRRRSIR